MRRTNIDYLVYIRESIELIERRSIPGREEVLADDVLFDAILHRRETLADAVSRLSDPLKQRHPAIPWRSITDFRNRLAHGYLTVRPERVWDVIIVHLPALKDVVEAELASPR